jgi:hypothetical protein
VVVDATSDCRDCNVLVRCAFDNGTQNESRESSSGRRNSAKAAHNRSHMSRLSSSGQRQGIAAGRRYWTLKNPAILNAVPRAVDRGFMARRARLRAGSE